MLSLLTYVGIPEAMTRANNDTYEAEIDPPLVQITPEDHRNLIPFYPHGSS